VVGVAKNEVRLKIELEGKAEPVTIGLPFVRTSVDHGTGFDIVQEGVADASSMVQAMTLAADLVARSGQPRS